MHACLMHSMLCSAVMWRLLVEAGICPKATGMPLLVTMTFHPSMRYHG